MQWQPEDRRATFTKKKSKLQWTCENQPLSNTLRQYPTDRSQGRNSPFSLLNPVVDPIKSPVLNKTFEVEEKSTKPSDRVASPERIVGQPDSTGSWLVSPPKRLKVKPPSDSPVVLPPPSRVARRSTMTQRFMDRPGSTPVTVAMGATTPRKAQAETKQQSGSVSRLVPRRLLLTSSSSQDSISPIGSMTSLATPSAFLCPPSATFLGHTIDLSKNPFREDTIQYLENSWIDDKEKELLKWVNQILSPPLEFQATCLMPSKQEMRPHVDTQQPQTTVHRLFSVLSYDIAHVLHKVHTAIEKGSIQVRADKDLHMDLGRGCCS